MGRRPGFLRRQRVRRVCVSEKPLRFRGLGSLAPPSIGSEVRVLLVHVQAVCMQRE